MGIIRRIFKANEVTLRDLKLAHLNVERRRREKVAEVERLQERQERLTEEARRARLQHNQLEVDYLWQEMKLLRTEIAIVRHDGRALNLEAIALRKTVHGWERLEAMNDRAGVSRLLDRVRRSGLDDKLLAQEIREKEYLEELHGILEDSGLGEAAGDADDDDPAKLAFLAELDALNVGSTGAVRAAPARESSVAADLEVVEDAGAS